MPSPDVRLATFVRPGTGVAQGWRLTVSDDLNKVDATSAQRELGFERVAGLWVALHDDPQSSDLDLVAHLAELAEWADPKPEAPAEDAPSDEPEPKKPAAPKRRRLAKSKAAK